MRWDTKKKRPFALRVNGRKALVSLVSAQHHHAWVVFDQNHPKDQPPALLFASPAGMPRGAGMTSLIMHDIQIPP
jgi:hypothetical protein